MSTHSAAPEHKSEDELADRGDTNRTTRVNGRRSAWAIHRDDTKLAPGAPGAAPKWAPAPKDGVGTALNAVGDPASRVWFTIAQGIITEVFYPRIDQACIRDLGLVVTDGQQFFSEERADCDHEIGWVHPGVPLYRVVNACRHGRYRIEKNVFSHPVLDAVLQVVRFTSQAEGLDAYQLFVLLAPHLANRGAGNTAWLGEHRGVPMLFAHRAERALALACSVPWIKGSAGYLGISDGWQDLSQHKQLTWKYDRAEDGNVALAGEVDLFACGGSFVLSLGLGLDHTEAAHHALASLQADPDELQAEYTQNWQKWQSKLAIPRRTYKRGRDLARLSAVALRAHESAVAPGAIIASLSTPWGEVRGDEQKEPGTGGYHLVWPRDLVEAAGGLLAVGAHEEALRVVRYLRTTQLTDGHWAQNMWVSGATFQAGVQLGETALPILLLDLLWRENVISTAEVTRYWPMVRRAAQYIVCKGPSTQEDRWENECGYTPFTLASVIAALLAAADLAQEQSESEVATLLRETADAWNAAIESWLYVVGTDLARRNRVEGYYARIIPPELDERSSLRTGYVNLTGADRSRRDRPVPGVSGPDALGPGIRIDEIVSPDALAFVRFGLRAADDPRIVNTVKVIDSVLKVDTPCGPVWRRYNGDGYGEKADGAPFDPKSRGIGRAWPLLTGERAHYELAAGHVREAIRLAKAMEQFAGEGGLLPEQVWDRADLPERGLFAGRPTGSAMPLVWAHAEYLKLRRSLSDGHVFDTPARTVQRYVVEKVGSPFVIWRTDDRRRAIPAGKTLRIELNRPAGISWDASGQSVSGEVRTRDSGLGIHIAELPTAGLPAGSEIHFTLTPNEAGSSEDDSGDPIRSNVVRVE